MKIRRLICMFMSGVMMLTPFGMIPAAAEENMDTDVTADEYEIPETDE